MSYKETDFPAIIKKLKRFSDIYEHPGLIEKLVKEIYKNYRYIPLYPGIIYDTLSRMIKKVKPDELKEKDWIAFEINGTKYAGYIKSVNGDTIQLENVIKAEQLKSLNIEKSKLSKLIKVNEKQLEEDWPMLIYEEKIDAENKILK